MTPIQIIETKAKQLVQLAEANGIVITIERRSLAPLAMARAETVIDVRHAAGADRSYGGTMPSTKLGGRAS